MKTFSIVTKKRTDLGKKSTKKLREEKQIPCVMYGGEEILHFYAHENDFRHLIYTDQVFLLDIDIDGKKYKAVLKEYQFHPVTDKVIHIDFVQVIDNKPTTVSLPVKLTGTSVGILAGGKLRLRKRYLSVKGLINDIPEQLDVNITKLKIGDVIKVSELSYNNIELVDQPSSMVVGVAASRLTAKGGAGQVVALDEDEEATEETDATEETEETAAE